MDSLLNSSLKRNQQICSFLQKVKQMDCLHDVAVIGGGVVGCAILHQMTKDGYDCVLVEKEEHLITGASSGNSAVYASGFDIERNTLEGRCLALSRSLREKIFKEYNLPAGKPGAIIIAMNDDEIKRLPELLDKARKHGASDCRLLTKVEVHQMEPNISDEVRAGMWVPGERAFEPWLLPITQAHVAKKWGAKILTSHKVIDAKRHSDGIWKIETTKGVINAKTVINAAGLYGDEVESFHGPSHFRIKPIRGEYIVYDKAAQCQVNHILFPVPTEITRGVLIVPTVHGNVIVGPTAVGVNKRTVDQVSESTVSSLKSYAERVIPTLASHQIIGTYAGLRPATEFSDYQIKHHPESNWVTVGGIRATGASGSLAIASYVNFLVKQGLKQQPSGPVRPSPQFSRPINWRATEKGTVHMDDEVYQITHPITYFGLVDKSANSKL